MPFCSVFLLVIRVIVHKGGQESERLAATALINLILPAEYKQNHNKLALEFIDFHFISSHLISV